ncbi:MAG: eCIS core domain-containing protein [Thermoanaerobaculia bacterium]
MALSRKEGVPRATLKQRPAVSARRSGAIAASPTLQQRVGNRGAQAIVARLCRCGGSCNRCRAAESHHVLRQATESSAPAAAPPIVHDVLRSAGQPLDSTTRAFMEPRFDRDLGHVRVHADAPAAASTEAVNALAYTVGSDIVFGTGQYDPGSTRGRKTLAHELTHVAQQQNATSLDRLTVGAPDDAFEQEADRIAGTIVDAQSNSLPPGSHPPVALQRKVILKGAEMISKAREAFVKTHKWSSTSLAKAVMQDMAEAADALDFLDERELELEIGKRLSTVQHMKESQAHVKQESGAMWSAFGYPFTDPAALYGPRVGYAARNYWEPAVPDNYAIRTDKAKNKQLAVLPRSLRYTVYGDPGPGYSWKLTSEGKKNPYKAIKQLFVIQPPHKRTLIHCDYLLSMVDFRSLADAIGETSFNARIQAYGVAKFRLKWNGFVDLESGILLSLRRVAPSSEADLVIGDHVVFFNHRAYDALNQTEGNAWRLENAVLIAKEKGDDVFQGHGSGRKTVQQMRDKLSEEFNDVAKKALALTAQAGSKDPKVKAKALADLKSKFSNVMLVGSEWRIRGAAYGDICPGSTVDEKLRKIGPKDVVGPRNPCDMKTMYYVSRPVEGAK